MNPSYLYHAFGVRHQECTKTEYKGNKNNQTKLRQTTKRNYAKQPNGGTKNAKR